MSLPALEFATLVEALRWRARTQADHLAFEFLPGAEWCAERITYAELDARARATATALLDHGFGGERALLVCPPGLDFLSALFGALYAGCIAVPAYPPARNQHLARLTGILRDARPAVALGTAAVLGRVPPLFTDGPPTTWLAVDRLSATGDDAWHSPLRRSDGLAILQYTSGSTDAPRGVILSHANLLHNAQQIARRFEITAASRGVIWLPPFHDMGLVGGILQGVYSGFPVTLMAPASFLRRPALWLEAISSRRATISGGPNFAYDLCVERVSADERARLDLSTWDVAFTGAEPIRPETLERFTAAFSRCGFQATAFYPCYGLAEATLMVTGGDRSAAPSLLTFDGHRLVGCGRAIEDSQVLIVDPDTRVPCPEGVVGEVWVRSPSVSDGYWNQPAATRATFAARTADTDDGPYLRTGDLGLVCADELYITGRLKSLLFVGGQKLHAEDLEHTVATSHPHGWPGGVAAVGVDDVGCKRLAIVQEVVTGDQAELERIVRAIRLGVAEQHGVPVSAIALLRPGRLARTSSGKVRRSACREALVAGALDALHQWRPAERP